MINKNIKGLVILIGSIIYFNACQMPTETVKENLRTSDSATETVSHEFVEGVTPANIDPDSAHRSYTVIQADWEGPGGDKKWLGQNLGATREAASISDDSPESAGWYFQFNHSQGLYPDRGNDEKVNNHKPGPANGRQDPDLDSNWIYENPCSLLLGDSWRIPTQAEWQAVAEADAASELNLNYSGYILGNLSFLSERGTTGFYWSSSQSAGANTGSYAGITDAPGFFVDNMLMWSGMPLRCIQD